MLPLPPMNRADGLSTLNRKPLRMGCTEQDAAKEGRQEGIDEGVSAAPKAGQGLPTPSDTAPSALTLACHHGLDQRPAHSPRAWHTVGAQLRSLNGGEALRVQVEVPPLLVWLVELAEFHQSTLRVQQQVRESGHSRLPRDL